MKARENSMAVDKRGFAFQSVPNQLISKIEAGMPSDRASIEKTRGEYGFRPTEKACSPQIQKPQRPTAHSASTTPRWAKTRLRANVATRCVTMPKHGTIAT